LFDLQCHNRGAGFHHVINVCVQVFEVGKHTECSLELERKDIRSVLLPLSTIMSTTSTINR
jgi:hypothetical protein